MLILISGKPGDGKSLKSMEMLEQAIEADKKEVSKGKPPRDFFTNVEGFDFDAWEAMTGYRVKLPPDDWRDTPEGSFIIYDEAHSDHLFPSTGRPGRSDDPRIRAFDQHRHTGHDFILMTQWPSKVHHEIRQMVGRHIHLNRSMGLEAAAVREWSRVQVDPYDEKVQKTAQDEIWSYPKKYYPMYKSSSRHTVEYKFKMPKKIKSGISTAITLLLLFAGFWWWMDWDLSILTGKPEQAQAQAAPAARAPGSRETPSDDPPATTAPPPTGAYDWAATTPTPVIAGCLSSEAGTCRCYNDTGFQIDMPEHKCRAVMEHPLPFNAYHEYKAPRGRDREERGRGAGGTPADMDAYASAPAQDAATTISSAADVRGVQQYGTFRSQPPSADPAFQGW